MWEDKNTQRDVAKMKAFVFFMNLRASCSYLYVATFCMFSCFDSNTHAVSDVYS